MKAILVAVDNHPHAEQVVENGVQLAKGMSAKIVLIYVIDQKSVPDRYRDQHGDALPEHYYQDLYLRTVGPLVKTIEAAGVKFEGEYLVGEPYKEIVKAAKAKGVSHIVVGIHQFKGVSRVRAIAEVARNVIENSTVPVLAVP